LATFSYRAVKPSGETVDGHLDAADQTAAVRALQRDGLIPVRVQEARTRALRMALGRSATAGRVPPKQVVLVTRELASLLEAGLTLDRSLQILRELAVDPQVAHLLERIQEKVRSGSTFSAALEAQGATFSPLYVNTVKAGEASGTLQAVMQRLADYMERSAELRESIKSALIYPTILLIVAGVSVALLLTLVVPQFAQMFEDMGQALPVATRIVIGAGDFVRGYWWLLILGVVGLSAAARSLLERPTIRYAWDRRLLGLPLVGELVAKVETARLSRTLATLLENGVSLLNALRLVKDVVTNRIISDAVQEAAEDLRHGRGLAEPLMKKQVLPQLALQMMKVGEESGQLDAMLGKVADVYDQEVRATVKRMLTLLEPMLIVGLGIIVAGIIMSILVAILSVNQLAF